MAFMSGKALFTYNPDLFEDAEGAVDDEEYDENFDENAQVEEKKDPNIQEEYKDEVDMNDDD